MNSLSSRAARVHLEVEGALARRFAGALSPRLSSEPERQATGIDALDERLGGGLPIGSLSELVGAESSGRTTVALSLLARITARDTVVAWIDASDAFDPESAALSGVDLRRLLWVRCPESQAAVLLDKRQQSTSFGGEGGFAPQQPSPSIPKGGGSPHPRSEAHGMSEAVASLLQAQPQFVALPDRWARRVVGTPGAPNRPVMRFTDASPHREEQIPTDRQPARRSLAEARAREAVTPAAKGSGPAPPFRLPVPEQEPRLEDAHTYSWAALDKALRVTDLLLQAGGFRLLVLDLGSVPPERAWRVPLSTWFRFRAACERTGTTLLLLTRHPCTKASAELVAQLSAEGMQVDGGVMTGLHFCLEVDRERTRGIPSKIVSIRKPPQAERVGRWRSQAAWAVCR